MGGPAIGLGPVQGATREKATAGGAGAGRGAGVQRGAGRVKGSQWGREREESDGHSGCSHRMRVASTGTPKIEEILPSLHAGCRTVGHWGVGGAGEGWLPGMAVGMAVATMG